MRALLALVVVMAAPAGADTAVVPKGCTAIVTVQAADCSVRSMWRCSGDAEGTLHVARYSRDGLVGEFTYDRNFMPIRRQAGAGGPVAELGDVTDPVDFARVLAEGRDSFSFRENWSTPPNMTVWGNIALTGETIPYDGRTLAAVAIDRWIQPDGAEAVQYQETAYYDAEWDILFGGTSRAVGEDGAVTDSSPIAFVLPGQLGFLSTMPEFRCQP